MILTIEEEKKTRGISPQTLNEIFHEVFDTCIQFGAAREEAFMEAQKSHEEILKPGRLVVTPDGKTGVLFQSCDYEGGCEWTVDGQVVDPEFLKYYGIVRPVAFCDMEDDWKMK